MFIPSGIELLYTAFTNETNYRFTFFFSQFKEDYNNRSYLGFSMAIWALPFVLVSKPENAISHDDMKGSLGTEKGAKEEEMQEKFRKREEDNLANNPYLKEVMLGNFEEMVERNVFKYA